MARSAVLQILQRLLAALPDAITAAVFLTAWVAPTRFGPVYVRDLTLVLAMEFIVIHSSVFYAIIVGVDVARGKRIAWLAGLSSLYLVFVFGFAIEYKSSWPVFAFAWLFVSRFLHVWISPASGEAEGARMVKLWAVSVVAYLFGAFTAILVPLPSLGMTSAFISSMMQSGGTGWSSGETHTTLAFGLLYFSILAAAKFALSGPPTARASADARTAQGAAHRRRQS
ncbi:MAG TPA: hypothetical protein VFE67_13540 [Rudaea sp.]|nr:hypothetical protein [Rudaea sp.]